MDVNKILNDFISEINQKYPKLVMGYEYIDDEDYYSVWHNDELLEVESNEFLTFIGDLYKNNIFDKGILNVAFGFDYIMAENVFKKKLKEILTSNNDCMQITISNSILISPTKIQTTSISTYTEHNTSDNKRQNTVTNYDRMAA